MPKSGFITASKFADVMTSGRGKDELFGKTALAYADEIVLQILGVEIPDISGIALDWGNEHEWEACQKYSERTLNAVTHPEFIVHPKYDYVGGTPDGLIGKDGIIEIKCPFNPRWHLENYRSALQFKSDYYAQIQGYLWITGRKWCDCISFDPRFPATHQIAMYKMERNEVFISELESRIVQFWAIVQSKLQEVTQ